jgi:hypothetical protein
MSANPAVFLAILALSEDPEAGEPAWSVFLPRLAYEYAVFSVSTELGIALLKILSDRPDLEDTLVEALTTNNSSDVLLKSMALALPAYEVARVCPGEVVLSKTSNLRLRKPLNQPEILNVPRRTMVKLFDAGVRLVCPTSSGEDRELSATPEGQLHLVQRRHAPRRPLPD